MKRRNWKLAIEKVLWEDRCRVCGSHDALDPAHIIPRSRGGDMDPLNIVPLCREHHYAYDGCELELLPYLTREEQKHIAGLVGLAEAYRRTIRNWS